MVNGSILKTVQEIFKSSNEPKNLKELYLALLELGFEDRGNITKHAIRGAVYELYKKKYIERTSIGVYKKTESE